jgi:hypothetical protein
MIRRLLRRLGLWLRLRTFSDRFTLWEILTMGLDFTKLKHEIDQLQELEQTRVATATARVEAETELATAENAFASALALETAAQSAVTAQIHYLAGLLGVEPLGDDPSPDPVSDGN